MDDFGEMVRRRITGIGIGWPGALCYYRERGLEVSVIDMQPFGIRASALGTDPRTALDPPSTTQCSTLTKSMYGRESIGHRKCS